MYSSHIGPKLGLKLLVGYQKLFIFSGGGDSASRNPFSEALTSPSRPLNAVSPDHGRDFRCQTLPMTFEDLCRLRTVQVQYRNSCVVIVQRLIITGNWASSITSSLTVNIAVRFSISVFRASLVERRRTLRSAPRNYGRRPVAPDASRNGIDGRRNYCRHPVHCARLRPLEAASPHIGTPTHIYIHSSWVAIQLISLCDSRFR